MTHYTFKYGRLINRMTKNDQYMTRYELVKFALIYGNKPAAREFKTSPSVVRKWVARYKSNGLSGLKSASKKPKHSPNHCPIEFEKEVIALRKHTKHRFGA